MRRRGEGDGGKEDGGLGECWGAVAFLGISPCASAVGNTSNLAVETSDTIVVRGPKPRARPRRQHRPLSSALREEGARRDGETKTQRSAG